MDSKTAPPRKLSVLVVDDDRDTAESQAALLMLYGFRARSVLTGDDAIRETTADPPDVLLLDIRLRDRDGWELARTVKAVAKGTVVISVTGCGEPDDFRRSGAAGIDMHLVKPVDPTFLVGVLRGIAGTRTSPKSGRELEKTAH